MRDIPISEQIAAVESEITRLKFVKRQQSKKGKPMEHTAQQLNAMRAVARTLRSMSGHA